jgi:hypothetical protein
MTTKRDAATRTPRKKLTLKKQTIRDLTTKRDAAAAVLGGGAPTNSKEGVIKCQ